MNRITTTILISTLTFAGNFLVLGWWAIFTAPVLLILPLYLIWVDSKKPRKEPWRYENR